MEICMNKELTSDNEIHEILTAVINACEASSVGEIPPYQFDEMIKEAKAQLTKYIEERERLARIDELKYVSIYILDDGPSLYFKSETGYDVNKAARLSELQNRTKS